MSEQPTAWEAHHALDRVAGRLWPETLMVLDVARLRDHIDAQVDTIAAQTAERDRYKAEVVRLRDALALISGQHPQAAWLDADELAGYAAAVLAGGAQEGADS